MITHSADTTRLGDTLRSRILILDGAMGTMLLAAGLTAPECELISQRPDFIAGIHRQYIAAGADIIRTATFSLGIHSFDRPAGSDFLRRTIREAVSIARTEAERADRKIYIAGCIGPVPPSVAAADIAATFALQYEAFAKAGADLVAIETSYDIVATEAALSGLTMARNRSGRHIPVLLSFTPLGDSAESRSEQIAAFKALTDRFEGIDIIGLNCGNDPSALVSHLDDLLPTSRAVALYPSCGLPDSDGLYRLSAGEFALILTPAVAAGKVNIVGGCCGSTPAHIKALADIAKDCQPHII